MKKRLTPMRKMAGGGAFKFSGENTGAAVSMAGNLTSGLIDAIDSEDRFGVRSGAGTAASGALKGAAAGAALGPVGAGVGAAIGLATSLVANNKAKKARTTALQNEATSRAFKDTQMSNQIMNEDPTRISGRQEAQMYKLGGPLKMKKMKDGGPMAKPTPKKKLGAQDRAFWNGFVDHVEKKGYKGSTKLDERDTNLSRTLFDEYASGQNYKYDDFIPQVQQSISDYRNTAIDMVKTGKAKWPGYKEDNNFDGFMPGLSNQDGWAGSKTTSWRFPEEKMAVVDKPNTVYKALESKKYGGTLKGSTPSTRFTLPTAVASVPKIDLLPDVTIRPRRMMRNGGPTDANSAISKPVTPQQKAAANAVGKTIVDPMDEIIDAPQKSMVAKLGLGYRKPAEALGIKNKYLATGVNTVFDPTNALFFLKSTKLAGAAAKAAQPKLVHGINLTHPRAASRIMQTAKKYKAAAVSSDAQSVYSEIIGSKKTMRNGGLMPLSSGAAEVKGPSHEGGGVKFPELGVELEGGETVANGFVYSKKLGFADKHKPIAKAMGVVEQMPSSPNKDAALNILASKEKDLAVAQENLKAKSGIKAKPTMRNGGPLRKMRDGGPTDDLLKFRKEEKDKADKAKASTKTASIQNAPAGGQFTKTDPEYYFYGKQGAMGSRPMISKEQIERDKKANPDKWKQAEERARDRKENPVGSFIKEDVLNDLTGYLDADWTNAPVQSAFNMVQGLAAVRGVGRGTGFKGTTQVKTPNTNKQLRLTSGTGQPVSGGKVKVVNPGNPKATAKDYPAVPTNSAVMGQMSARNLPVQKANTFTTPLTPVVLTNSSSPTNSGNSGGSNNSNNSNNNSNNKVNPKKPKAEVVVPKSLTEDLVAMNLSGKTTRKIGSASLSTLGDKMMAKEAEKLKVWNNKIAEAGKQQEAAADAKAAKAANLGKIVDGVTPFISNISNAFRRLPLPPKATEQANITPALVNYDADRAEAVRQRRGADKVATESLNGGNAAAATRAANLTQSIRSMNTINQAENSANVGIKNQALQTNAAITANNNAKTDLYNTQLVERQLKTQELKAENLADMGNKSQVLARDKKMFQLEEDRIMLEIGDDPTGAKFRTMEPFIKKRYPGLYPKLKASAEQRDIAFREEQSKSKKPVYPNAAA